MCLLAAAACLPLACKTPDELREEADREVYQLIRERRASLEFGEEIFTIEPNPDSLRERITRGEVTELPPLTLETTLLLAAANSRDFQSQKERLYLAALDLTLARWRFAPQGSGLFAASASDFGSSQTGATSGTAGLDKLFGTGAQILSDIGLSFARDLSTGDGWSAITDIGLTITQPLMRGGRIAVTENLTQAERTLAYEVWTYERFRRTFAVDVASRLYRLAQQRNAVENEVQNSKSLAQLREKNEALAQAGRLSEIQVDQARQNELSSLDRLLTVRQRFSDQLDELKFFLGLPVEFTLDIDHEILDRLVEAGAKPHGWEPAVAVQVARMERLDYRAQNGRLEDAERRIGVAADALRAGLDMTLNLDLSSTDGKPLDFDFDDATWSLAGVLDLPINIREERNAYRAAIVSAEVAKRNKQQLDDRIAADIRASLRSLTARRESYDIQVGAVRLAERRVESARLNLDAGRSETRDLLEAQAALLGAQNAATGALIDYALAELELYRDMELLRVGPDGIELVEAPASEGMDE